MTNEQSIPVYLNCYGKYVTAWDALKSHHYEVVFEDGKIQVRSTEVIGYDPELAARILADLNARNAAIDKAEAEGSEFDYQSEFEMPIYPVATGPWLPWEANPKSEAELWEEIAALCQPNGGDA